MPGEENLESVGTSSIKVVVTWHEQAAAFVTGAAQARTI